MCPIGVKEATAIGTEVLDELQRGHRPLRNDLLRHLHRLHDGLTAEIGDWIAIAVDAGLLITGWSQQRHRWIGLEVRRHALPDEQQPTYEREGSSTQRVARVRSTQKLPRPVMRSRTRPRKRDANREPGGAG